MGGRRWDTHRSTVLVVVCPRVAMRDLLVDGTVAAGVPALPDHTRPTRAAATVVGAGVGALAGAEVGAEVHHHVVVVAVPQGSARHHGNAVCPRPAKTQDDAVGMTHLATIAVTGRDRPQEVIDRVARRGQIVGSAARPLRGGLLMVRVAARGRLLSVKTEEGVAHRAHRRSAMRWLHALHRSKNELRRSRARRGAHGIGAAELPCPYRRVLHHHPHAAARVMCEGMTPLHPLVKAIINAEDCHHPHGLRDRERQWRLIAGGPHLLVKSTDVGVTTAMLRDEGHRRHRNVGVGRMGPVVVGVVVVVLSFGVLEECKCVWVSEGTDRHLVCAATTVIAVGGISARETWMLARLAMQAVTVIAPLTAVPISSVMTRATVALSMRRTPTEVVQPQLMSRDETTVVAVAMTMAETATSISMSLLLVLVMLSGLLRMRTRTRGTRGLERMETASMKTSTMVR